MSVHTLLLANAAELLTCAPSKGDPLGKILNGAVAMRDGIIVAVGETRDLLARADLEGAERIDCSGKVVAPGYVDSHTHVIFGGSRVREYALRLTRSAEELHSLGIPTGIAASVAMTRAESEAELFASARDRVLAMLRAGTTTIESKSGYGLTTEQELKMLWVSRRLDQDTPLDVISTYLGAHAIPDGIAPEKYVQQIVGEQIPAVVSQGIAEFCDVYVEDGYFDPQQARRILQAASAAGLKLKIHADQYSRLGAAELAAEMGAVSADHLNYTDTNGMEKLAEAGVVGVLMPLIDFAVQHPHPFDVPAMRRAGLTLALATDLCPGGWTESMQLVIQFACRSYGFSLEEAILAATTGGARALGLHDRGQLVPGMLADVQIWNIPTAEDLVYRLGNNSVETVFKRGRWAAGREPQSGRN